MSSSRIRAVGARVWFLPVRTRVPLKFGVETLDSVTCARVELRVEDDAGRIATGHGETPLSVQWVWPSDRPYEPRHRALREFTLRLAPAIVAHGERGHPIEVGHAFTRDLLGGLLDERNSDPAHAESGAMPHLAALVCLSAFDIALHDAHGKLHDVPIYSLYGRDALSRDLAAFLEPAAALGGAGGTRVDFRGTYPSDFLVKSPPARIPAWHLVGGKDLLDDSERDGSEPEDGYPVTLREWIARDGLRCLKIKLRGDDPEWDRERLRAIGRIAEETDVRWLSADFNCTVRDPAYVVEILDHLLRDDPRTFARILYVEQPFPYDLERHRIDVRSVAARKPLFMDESAHDWELVRLGRELGWTGVALKTCKTQTGALLSLAWARAHGMTLMVQDLTNPMLAQIPHALLGAHAGTIQGVETNSMQFYPEASAPEARVHPGLYRRRDGMIDLSTLRGPGFGYRVEEIQRDLGAAAIEI